MRIVLIIILLLSNFGLGTAYGITSESEVAHMHSSSIDEALDLETHTLADSTDSLCDSANVCGCNICSAHCSALVFDISLLPPKTFDEAIASSLRLFVVSAVYPTPERPPKPL